MVGCFIKKSSAINEELTKLNKGIKTLTMKETSNPEDLNGWMFY